MYLLYRVVHLLLFLFIYIPENCFLRKNTKDITSNFTKGKKQKAKIMQKKKMDERKKPKNKSQKQTTIILKKDINI